MREEEFSFDPLSRGLMLPKPVSSIKDEHIVRLETEGRCAKTRKRDGYRLWVVNSSRIKLYTRGLKEITPFFPHIVEQLEGLGLPAKTFLDGEFLIDKDGADDFSSLQKICAPLFSVATRPERIATLQKEFGFPEYMLFDVVFFSGEKYISLPWQKRQETLLNILARNSSPNLSSLEILDCSFSRAKELVQERGWEGMVIYDTQGRSDFRLDGKVARPRVAWKWKPIYESDFIARRWIPRKGDPTTLKEFELYQIDRATGKDVYCGKCGGGLTNRERIELANDTLYPLVVEIKFYDRYPSGKPRHASFLRVREDKTPDECFFLE